MIYNNKEESIRVKNHLDSGFAPFDVLPKTGYTSSASTRNIFSNIPDQNQSNLISPNNYRKKKTEPDIDFWRGIVDTVKDRARG